MGVTKIVLTGGPCAGKSTGLAIIEERLKSLGYDVIILNEMATQVMGSGVRAANIGDEEFQGLLIKMMLNRDKAYNNITKYLGNKVVMIYDRGLMDGKAYCSEEAFKHLLEINNLTQQEIFSMYDGVFHLVTAANGAEWAYTTSNNKTRLETVDQAVEADNKTLATWIGHPHLRVINNDCNGFEQKMSNLLKEIMSLLGEPVPMEIERKYLIKMPSIKNLQGNYKMHKSEIIQTYLISDSTDIERRVRQRGQAGDMSYYYTEKSPVSFGKRKEIERIITQSEYTELLLEADTSRKQIKKTRYCFVYKDRYFELDVYPFWKDQAILEIELEDIDEKVELPPEIEIIRDVTGDKAFSNAALAAR